MNRELPSERPTTAAEILEHILDLTMQINSMDSEILRKTADDFQAEIDEWTSRLQTDYGIDAITNPTGFEE